jgi:hypothetical protein
MGLARRQPPGCCDGQRKGSLRETFSELRDPVTSPPLPVPDRFARGQAPPSLAATFCFRAKGRNIAIQGDRPKENQSRDVRRQAAPRQGLSASWIVASSVAATEPLVNLHVSPQCKSPLWQLPRHSLLSLPETLGRKARKIIPALCRTPTSGRCPQPRLARRLTGEEVSIRRAATSPA